MPKYIHIKSTGVVLGFSEHLLHRNDVEIVSSSKAKQLIAAFEEKQGQRIREAEERRVQDVIAAAQARQGGESLQSGTETEEELEESEKQAASDEPAEGEGEGSTIGGLLKGGRGSARKG